MGKVKELWINGYNRFTRAYIDRIPSLLMKSRKMPALFYQIARKCLGLFTLFAKGIV